MIISIASGKGGTGKTTVAVNLALTLAETESVCFMDCDVEEPNAHLFLKPVLEGSAKVTVPVPIVDEEQCNGCGLCGEICAFNAILPLVNHVLTFPELCHGCGGCALFCPTGAVREEPLEIGVVEWGHAGPISHIHGRLKIGSPLAPPIVKAVKDRKRNMPGGTVFIIDAPPGTSCPVVASVTGKMCIRDSLKNEDDPVIWRGPLIAGAVKQFWTDVIWGKLDCLIVDLPPGTGDVPITVMQSLPLDGVVIVSSPQDVAAMIVKKAMRMASMMNTEILGLVELCSMSEMR